MIGFVDPQSPLFGRHYTEIRMRSLSGEESVRFLRAGFHQVGVECPEDVIQYAVEGMDGVIGWLTLFGARCRDAVRDVLLYAVTSKLQIAALAKASPPASRRGSRSKPGRSSSAGP